MIAGRLEIELAMGLARLQQDVAGAKSSLAGLERDVGRFASGISRTLGAIGVGLSVGGIVALFKSVTDAGDEAFKSAQKVGVSVEEWQKYSYAAKLAGVNSEQLAKGLKNMGDFVQQVTVHSAESVDMMKRLGVSLRDSGGNVKTTSALLLDMADRFSTMPDGLEKTTAATKVFGKAGMELLPFLNQGRAGIEDLMREAERLGIVMDGDTARAAEALNDNVARLQTGMRGLAVQAIAPLIPFLNGMVEGLAKARIEGGGISKWSEAATAGFRLLASGAMTVKAVFEALGNTLGGVGAAAAALFSGEFKRAGAIIQQVKQDNAGIWEGLGKDLAGLWDGVKKGAIEAEKPLQKLGATGIKSADQLKALKQAAKDQEEEWKRLAEAEQALARAHDAARKAGDDLIGQLVRGNRDIEFETKLIGMTTQARELAILARQKEKDLMVATGPEQRELIERLYQEREALVLLRQGREADMAAQQQQIGLWTQVADVAGNFFSDLVMNGKSAFDNLRKWVKQLLADMIALFAKRWVLNMAAGGSLMGSAGNALAGGIGSDTIAGGLLTNAAGFVGTMALGAGGAGALGATAGGAFAQGMMGMGTGVWASGSAGAMGASLSGVYTALAAIPVWGWIAMAVIAIGAWIAGNHKGGDKVGGSFFSGGAVPGTDNGRFFTPNQGDAGMQQLVQATSNGYLDAISRLGGTAGSFNFGLGFDHDPRGTARSRVSSMLTDASGRVIYSAMDREMDDKEVEGALGLESQRMIIAALQNSDLHDDLDAFFDSIGDVANLTGEQINAILAKAVELKNVIDVLEMWDIGLTVEGLRAMAFEGETLTQTLQSVAQAQQTYYQLFYTEEENLARNTELLQKQFKAMGLEMPTTREGFRQLVEGLDLTTEEGARLYRWLLEIAPAFADIVPPLEDVVDVVGDVADAAVAATVLIDAAMNQNVRPWEDIFGGYYASKPARSSLADNLRRSLMGTNSPLDPMQRLAAAQGEFDRLLALSQGGDLTAIGQLGGARDSLIEIARSIFGSSSAFVEIFNRTFDQAATIAEIPGINEQMLKIQTDSLQYQAEMAASLRDSIEIQSETRDLLRDISRKSAPATADSWSER